MKAKFTNWVKAALLLLIVFFTGNLRAQLYTPKLRSVNSIFIINGEVRRHTAEADWVDSASVSAWTGKSILSTAGAYLFADSLSPLCITRKVVDVYNGKSSNPDNQFDGGNKSNGNPTSWGWKLPSNAVLNKNDVNNVLVHFTESKTNPDSIWALLGVDRNTTSGTSYVDFEFYQAGIAGVPPPGGTGGGGTFSTTGPNCGRTVGDLLITVQYTNGGVVDSIIFFKWAATSSSCGYDWVQFPISNKEAFGYSTNVTAANVPWGAFGGTSYSQNQMAEIAINLTAAIDTVRSANACRALIYRTLFVKSKSSSSTTADLKDMITPIDINLNLGLADISYNGPYCAGTGSHPVTFVGPNNTKGGKYRFVGSNSGNVVLDSLTGTVTTNAGASGQYCVGYYYSLKSGCNKADTACFTVNAKPSSSTTQVNASCNGATDGSIDLTVSPAGTYTYAWRKSPSTTVISTVEDPTGLSAGTYGVKITSTAGCTDTNTVVITEPNALTLVLTPTDADCFGASNGSISAAFGGGGTLEIKIDGNAFAAVSSSSPQVFSGLAAGTHTVILRRSNATTCSITSTATVGQPNTLTLTLTPTDATCNGASDGSVSAAFGGGGTLEIKIDGNAFAAVSSSSPQVFSGLAAGTHTVILRRSNATTCSITSTATVG
ncbi:MAG: SprB repeat-containing protein, partial [Bacteroidetes bacterium]|nr:SprB repeat-containing protein [Bacteroidota bacterium]